jgi:hypothetical protein
MKFSDALALMKNNKKVIRRPSWPKNQKLTSLRSALTIEDSMASDWEVVESRLSDLKKGDKFDIPLYDNKELVLLEDINHLVTEYKYAYYDNCTNYLFATKEDLVVNPHP